MWVSRPASKRIPASLSKLGSASRVGGILAGLALFSNLDN